MENHDQINENPISTILKNNLDDETLRHRNKLIIMCIIGFIFLKLNITPSEFSPLGIKFKDIDVNSIIIILFIVHSYFYFIFLTCLSSDISNLILNFWQAKLWNTNQLELGRQPPNRNTIWIKPINNIFNISSPRYLNNIFLLIGFLRVFFDFLFPIIIGSYIQILFYKNINF